MINGKVSLSYNDVSAALMNHEVRKDKASSSNSTTTEALTTSGLGFYHRKSKKEMLVSQRLVITN